MSAVKFWILTLLALAIAVLVVLEISNNNQVAGLSDAVTAKEAYLGQAQRSGEMLRVLVQRLASDSAKDPALADLLAKRGVHFTTHVSGSSMPGTPSSATNSPPAAPSAP
jgi:hypothetical protein